MLLSATTMLLELENNFKKILAVVILVGHLVAMMSFGATFWVDGIIYLDMAHYLIQGNLSEFYSPIMTCIASHFPLLPSLIWAVIYPLFQHFTWIAYSFIQHLLAGMALYYLMIALMKYLPKISLLVASIVLVCYPFYQSFHNMIMTESLASSFLILMVGASIFLLSKPRHPLLHELIFIGAVFLGIQSRPQIALFAVGLIFSQFYLIRSKLWRICVFTLFVMLSYVTFPTLRWIFTGKFFQPSIACLSVRTSLMSQVGQPNSKAVKIINKYKFPEEIEPSRAVVEGLTYEQSLAWSKYLINQGMDEQNANQYMGKIANEIRFSSVESITSQIDSALSGIGLLKLSIFHNNEDVLSEGMSKEYWTNHYTNHYKWLSWTSEIDHTDIFDDFVGRFEAIGWYHPNSINMMKETMRSYISKSGIGRNIFSLSAIPTDLFSLLWILGVISFIGANQRLLVMALGVPVVINYIVVLYVGFGNIRYFYLAVPFVVITATITVYKLVALTLSKRGLLFNLKRVIN